jgi:phosphocarrier protein HPr
MIRHLIQVRNRLGLHARAAAKLVRLTSRFKSEILLSRNGNNQQADARSILGVLMLAASQGTSLILSIDGEDEAEAGAAILRLFEEKFGEEN